MHVVYPGSQKLGGERALAESTFVAPGSLADVDDNPDARIFQRAHIARYVNSLIAKSVESHVCTLHRTDLGSLMLAPANTTDVVF